MAVLKGIKEKVHLPLYDSLFVQPGKQLREIETSSVFRFFVTVQGKSKLETNMQAASLLPHWNTFEARALRVVISDLPPKFPAEIEKCLQDPTGMANGTGQPDSTASLYQVPDHFNMNGSKLTPQLVGRARQRVDAFNSAFAEAGEIPQDLDECLGLLRAYCNPQKMGRMLQLHRSLRLIRADLANVIQSARKKSEKLSQFVTELEEIDDTTDDFHLLKQLDEGNLCLDALERLVGLARRVKETGFEEVETVVTAAEHFVQTASARGEQMARAPKGSIKSQTAFDQTNTTSGQSREDEVRDCISKKLSDKLKIPLDEQLFGDTIRIFSRLIFNSVTTFFVGEKVMIQMPTWFFPAGGGPYSGNGRVINHGFPAPEATFRFAEPVMIDAQQNFRVEMEIPDSIVLGELQRIYGPFFVWVTLDGYMQRDVQ